MLLSAGRSPSGCAAATGLARPGIDEFSVATEKLTSVLYRYPGPCVTARADVLWASPTGSSVLGYLSVIRQSKRPRVTANEQTGVFAGGKFLPLPIRMAVGPPSAATIAF
jgi:hypothetical protein